MQYSTCSKLCLHAVFYECASQTLCRPLLDCIRDSHFFHDLLSLKLLQKWWLHCMGLKTQTDKVENIFLKHNSL